MAIPLNAETNSMHIMHTPKANGPAHRNIQLCVIHEQHHPPMYQGRLAKSVYSKIRNSGLKTTHVVIPS